MEKYIALLLTLVILLLTACGTPQPTTATTTELTSAPTTEATTVPTTELITAPTTEPTTTPTTEPTTTPTTEPTTTPTTEPTTAPTTEATTAPTIEPTTAPTTEPTTTPAPTPTNTLTINTADDTTIFVGETLQISYEYSGDKSNLNWTSRSTDICSVDNNGKVTAKSAGSVIIVVSDGSITKRITINVKSPSSKTTSIEIHSLNAPLSNGVNKFAGDSMTLKAYTLPYGGDASVTVTSSNSSVVSVSCSLDSNKDNNITLNFKSAGSATVTITSGDGAVSKSYSINVKSGYACNPGSDQLTPEQWAECCTQVMVENGFNKNTSCGSYRVLTLDASELTFAKAKSLGQTYVHTWYPNGCRSCWISYEGINENGKHVFYTRWG